MRHRACGARDLDPGGGEALAGLVDIRNANREVAKTAAQRIGLLLIPVVGQLNDRAVGLVAIADKGERELAGWVVALPQQLHAELLGVELQRFVQILDPEHRVQEPGGAGFDRAGGPCSGIGYRHWGLLLHCTRRLSAPPRCRAAIIARMRSAALPLGDGPAALSRRTASSYPSIWALRTRSSRTSWATAPASRSGVHPWPKYSAISGRSRMRLIRLTWRTRTTCASHAWVSGFKR